MVASLRPYYVDKFKKVLGFRGSLGVYCIPALKGEAFKRKCKTKEGGYEIDLVGIKGNKALFVEVKWRDNVNGDAILNDLKKKADLTGWKGEKEFLIIAKSFKKRAADATCWDLNDLEGLLSYD